MNSIILSLTTVPPRFKFLFELINNLKTQTIEVNIIINIPIKYKKYDNNFEIPPELFKIKNVIIHRCTDYGAATKLLGTLEYLNKTNNNIIEYIITVDDDLLYYDKLIEDLYLFYKTKENHVICNAGLLFLKKPYKLNNKDTLFITNSKKIKKNKYVHVAEGYAGVLYKKSFFKNDIFSYSKKLPTNIFYDDDLFISSYLSTNNIPIIVKDNVYYHTKQWAPSVIKVLGCSNTTETYKNIDNERGNIHNGLTNFLINNNFFSIITLVTCIYDIRQDKGGIDFYVSRIKNIINLNFRLIIYTDKNIVKLLNINSNKVIIKIMELSEIKKNLNKIDNLFDKIDILRKKKSWWSFPKWNIKDSPLGKYEFYIPITLYKIFFMYNESINVSNKNNFIFWVDAGLTSVCKINRDFLFKITELISDKLYFQTFKGSLEGTEIHGLTREGYKYIGIDEWGLQIPRGGIFGGKSQIINNVFNLYKDILVKIINKNFLGTEEAIFCMLLYKYSELFYSIECGKNGYDISNI